MVNTPLDQQIARESLPNFGPALGEIRIDTIGELKYLASLFAGAGSYDPHR
jgi:hypothetical protein